jgi:hypothetical protein
LELVVGKNTVFLGWIFCEGENESTRDLGRGQSQIIVQFENLSASFSMWGCDAGESVKTRYWSDAEHLGRIEATSKSKNQRREFPQARTTEGADVLLC